MKSKCYGRMAAFAALMIIGCSISSMCSSCKRRGHQQRQLEEAISAWEDEGGAVTAWDDDEEELVPKAG